MKKATPEQIEKARQEVSNLNIRTETVIREFSELSGDSNNDADSIVVYLMEKHGVDITLISMKMVSDVVSPVVEDSVDKS